MARIGPRFAEELRAAGVADHPFTWDAEGVELLDSRLPQTVKDAILAVLAAHDPLLPATPSPAAQATSDFQAFKFPTPEQVDAAIDAVATLADAKVILRRLAKAMLYLARATGVDL